MRVNIIKVGNSKGLILSKSILEKYQFKNQVNIRLEDQHLIIEPIDNPREGWDAQFAAEHSLEESELLIPDAFEDEKLLPSWE